MWKLLWNKLVNSEKFWKVPETAISRYKWNKIRNQVRRFQGAGKKESGKKKSEIWNLKPETWNLKPETWNLEPGTWFLFPVSLKNMEQIYLAVYDIRDERRLQKVAKIMENYGVRVQKSVFEAALNGSKLRDLKSDLLQVIDPVEDGVKFFQLCERCQQSVRVIGHGGKTDLLESLVVI